MSKTETPEQFRERIGQVAREAEMRTAMGEYPAWPLLPWDELEPAARGLYEAMGEAVYTQALRDVRDAFRICLTDNAYMQTHKQYAQDVVANVAASLGIDLTESEAE